jgi:hypothetical protein
MEIVLRDHPLRRGRDQKRDGQKSIVNHLDFSMKPHDAEASIRAGNRKSPKVRKCERARAVKNLYNLSVMSFSKSP